MSAYPLLHRVSLLPLPHSSTSPLHVALYNRNDDLAKVIANSFYCDCDRAVYLKDMRRVHNPMEDEPPCTCRAPPLNVNVTNDYGYST